jgi:hypothetical protein
MKKMAIVGAAASLCLVGTAGTSALATAHHQPAAKHKLHITLSNYKPKSGDKVKATLHNAKNGVQYACLFTTYKKGVKLSIPDSFVTTATQNHTGKNGKAHCTLTFQTGTTVNGHSCPPSKKDKKAGWKCGFVMADPNAQGNPQVNKNYSVALFKF